ncbi:hypothetical protein BJX66DRAFT_305135 [Aspergillus keveii]|uniref:Ubiquitin-like protease family profile domain-containing protein n=1 Tax=Aspergillus keveii TaxID=714993 RepID=A0ABR4G5I4_9EURO
MTPSTARTETELVMLLVASDHDALTKWINEPCSPQTEEIHRDKIPESVISLPSTRQATPESIHVDTQCTKDLIIQAVRTIYGLSTHRDDELEARAASSYDQWSGGSTWKLTRKKKQVGRRGAAITVMNRIQEGAAYCVDNRSCMRGVGRITLEEDEYGLLLMRERESITIRQRELQRRRIHMKYTKSSIAKIDNMKGTPDLATFFKDLVDTRLMIDNKLRELQVEFPVQSRSLPDATLETAINHLVELVSTKVLNKATPESGDIVVINSSMELSCEIFNRLRPGECWAKKIAQHHREAKDDFGEACPLVYFCLINHGNKHFTLLEINERKQVICYYDSMADSDTILGVKESRLAGLVKGEFKNLKFSYIKVVSAFLCLLWRNK